MKNIEKGPNVLVYGTFDLLHAGHFNLLYKAHKVGNVYAVIRPSSEVEKDKGFIPHQDDLTRKKNLEKILFVKNVDIAPWDVENTVRLCREHDIDYIVAGTDHLESEIHKESSRLSGAKVIFFDRTDDISSTELREKLRERKD